MKVRRKARTLALQALYEADCTHHPAEDVISQRLEEQPLSEDGGEFARSLVTGVRANLEMLDRLIQTYASEWPLDQMAIIDRNILRLALWELAVDRQTPLKVVINEAVELAKEYGADSAPRFVNGVLGSLAPRFNDLAQALKGAHHSPAGNEPSGDH